MEIKLVDVTVHIDEELDEARRADVEAAVRGLDGAVSVHLPVETPHLMVVGYNPEKTSSKAILDAVLAQGTHAELVGL